MNIPKKLLIIFTAFTAMLAGIAFMASCSKEPGARKPKQQQTRDAKTVKKTATTTPKKQTIPLDSKNAFIAIRNGQYVNLNWHFDATGSKIKQILVMRNSTGTGNKVRIANLDPGANDYKDCLLDENAYWYWLRINMLDGGFLEIGPARVPPDAAGASHYINVEEKYKASITRTDEMAGIIWDFPEDEYKTISIIRFPRFVAELKGFGRPGAGNKGAARGVSVATTLERKSRYTDALPDANLDYWYWFRITLKSGAVIDRGPIKAEYTAR